MQSLESLSGKDLPLSSSKPFRWQTQKRPLETVQGSFKSPPRLTLYQHSLPPPCLVWKYRHEQAHGQSWLPSRKMPGVKKKEGNHKSCNQAPHSPNTQRNLESREHVLLQNTKLAHTAEGPLEIDMQMGHRLGLQLLVWNIYDRGRG